MANSDYQRMKDQLVEQKITQRSTITAGSTGVVSVTIPSGRRAFLKGYGYSWYTANTYQLSAGSFAFPSRTDQEGSTSIPVIYGNPYPVSSGETVSVSITNGDSADHTYDVVFYILATGVLPVNSTGGELILATGGASAGGNAVYITDSSGASAAPVDSTLGIAINSKSPTTLLSGSKVTSSASAVALAASTACRKVTIQVDSSSDDVLIGNATDQSVRLVATQSIEIEISNLSLIYIKRSGANNVTVNYIGS